MGCDYYAVYAMALKKSDVYERVEGRGCQCKNPGSGNFCSECGKCQRVVVDNWRIDNDSAKPIKLTNSNPYVSLYFNYRETERRDGLVAIGVGISENQFLNDADMLYVRNAVKALLESKKLGHLFNANAFCVWQDVSC